MTILDLSPGDQTITVSGDTTLPEVFAALPAGTVIASGTVLIG